MPHMEVLQQQLCRVKPGLGPGSVSSARHRSDILVLHLTQLGSVLSQSGGRRTQQWSMAATSLLNAYRHASSLRRGSCMGCNSDVRAGNSIEQAHASPLAAKPKGLPMVATRTRVARHVALRQAVFASCCRYGGLSILLGREAKFEMQRIHFRHGRGIKAAWPAI